MNHLIIFDKYLDPLPSEHNITHIVSQDTKQKPFVHASQITRTTITKLDTDLKFVI